MKVVCFGDSNTYGYDPRSFFGGRYPAEHRWVDILSDLTGWDIRNGGMNGREIPRGCVTFPEDTRLLIVMLGTNDLLQGRGVEATVLNMERFLKSLSIPRGRILLIAPPPMVHGEWVTNEVMIEASRALAAEYQHLAERMNVLYADTGEWEIPMCFDGVHFTEEGHRRFAEGLLVFLKTAGVI